VVSRKFIAVLVLALVLLESAAPADEAVFDVLIRGGQVVDGTGNPWFHADVAIKGERIVAIGRSLAGTARREIDAGGLVVAPGFIDMHSHSDMLLLEDGNAQSKIRQGVTRCLAKEVPRDRTSVSFRRGPFK
jgi:N-acyl-D-aspartate/D-glutamate deacylase